LANDFADLPKKILNYETDL